MEPTADEHQVISFLDSLLASKKNMQQKASLPTNSSTTENQYIESEYDNSEIQSPVTVANGQKQCSKSDAADMINKPKTIYGLVGVQRYVS